MSLDRSLKTQGGLVRHRNVLKRDERLAVLEEEERWTDEESVYGLPKVGHRKAAVGGKTKKAAAGEEAEGATEGEAKEATPT